MESPCTASIVSTDEIVETQEFTLFPNPTSNIVNIDSKFPIRKWELHSNNGEYLQTGFTNSIDLSFYPNGLFYLKINDGKNYYIEKIIKLE